MREHDRQRHQLRRLAGRETVHHSLVAGALLLAVAGIDAHGDIGRLPVDAHQNPRILAVDAVLRIRVSYLLQCLPDDPLHVREPPGRDFPCNDHKAGGRHRFDRNPRRGILAVQLVEDRVADLVADLVRVTFRHALAGEK